MVTDNGVSLLFTVPVVPAQISLGSGTGRREFVMLNAGLVKGACPV